VADSSLGAVGGAEVVACGRNALLRLLVPKRRREADAEICLDVKCLWLAHLILRQGGEECQGASRVERGDALERMRASAALRSSIDLCRVTVSTTINQSINQ